MSSKTNEDGDEDEERAPNVDGRDDDAEPNAAQGETGNEEEQGESSPSRGVDSLPLVSIPPPLSCHCYNTKDWHWPKRRSRRLDYR